MKAAGEHPHLNRSDVASWVRQFLPAVPSIIVPSLGVGDTQVLGGVGAGDPVLAEINSLGITGLQIEAAGDDFHWLWMPPSNLDTSAPVKVSAIWTSNSTTTTQTATWKVLYGQDTFNSGAMAAAATALDTAIAADNCLGTAYVLQQSPEGLIGPGDIDPAKMMHILCELDAVSGLNPASDVVFLVGIMIEYLRAKL